MTSLKICGGKIFLFITGKKQGPMNLGNNLSVHVHDLRTFVATLWSMDFSVGSCSIWTVILLHMV